MMGVIRAKCPYCAKENGVGLAEVERVGETATWTPCIHFVFFGPTRFPGIYYAEHVARVGHLVAGRVLEAELLRILNGYFKFVGPVAFAPSGKTREDARTAVQDFLKARSSYHRKEPRA